MKVDGSVDRGVFRGVSAVFGRGIGDRVNINVGDKVGKLVG